MYHHVLNHGASMTQNNKTGPLQLVQSTEHDPRLLLIREWESTNDGEECIEKALPLWSLIDMDQDSVLCRSTLRPLLCRIKGMLHTAALQPNTYVEFIYTTASSDNPKMEPEAVILPLRDVMKWIEETCDEMDIAKKLYREDYPNIALN